MSDLNLTGLSDAALDELATEIERRRSRREYESWQPRAPIIDPDSPAGRMTAAQDAARAKRVAAAASAEAEAKAQREALERAAAQRAAENGPKIAALQAEIARLQTIVDRLDKEYRRRVAPTENKIAELRRRIRELGPQREQAVHPRQGREEAVK